MNKLNEDTDIIVYLSIFIEARKTNHLLHDLMVEEIYDYGNAAAVKLLFFNDEDFLTLLEEIINMFVHITYGIKLIVTCGSYVYNLLHGTVRDLINYVLDDSYDSISLYEMRGLDIDDGM